MKAFPRKNKITPDDLGMDLRDYFAAKAIPIAYKHHKEWLKIDLKEYLVWNQGLSDSEINCEMIAEKCYSLADAMMKVRLGEDSDD